MPKTTLISHLSAPTFNNDFALQLVSMLEQSVFSEYIKTASPSLKKYDTVLAHIGSVAFCFVLEKKPSSSTVPENFYWELSSLILKHTEQWLAHLKTYLEIRPLGSSTMINHEVIRLQLGELNAQFIFSKQNMNAPIFNQQLFEFFLNEQILILKKIAKLTGGRAGLCGEVFEFVYFIKFLFTLIC